MKLILYQATIAITEIDFVPGPFRFQIELGHLDFAVDGLYYRPFWSVMKLQTSRKQVCGSLFPKFEVCRMVSARGGRCRSAGFQRYSEALCSGMTL